MMPLPRRFPWVFGLIAGGVLAAATQAAQPPTLPGLLGWAAAYVATYEQSVAAFVFEEEYLQRVSCVQAPRFGGLQSLGGLPPQSRRLRSEVVVINTGDLGWVGFRDVFEVDGKPVRNREDRLQKLFVHPGDDALLRARAVANESARFNLGSVHRNLNYPTMALMFLREANQGRSRFSRGDSERLEGVATWVVRFQEASRPTLIGSRAKDVAASGQFWIEPDSGRVRRSRLSIQEERATGTFDVDYAPWPDLDILMPVSMKEDISVRGCVFTADPDGRETITGEARYSNVKRFTVDVTSNVAGPHNAPK
jgi:hypothetical protein